MGLIIKIKSKIMKSLSNLQPEKIWSFFSEITQIPRPSKKEEKIIQYLLDFGKKYHLETGKDATGNIVIRKPASKGMENLQSVVLQSHMDMVCEKDGNVNIDFENDPVQAYVDGEWVKAKGTTLGADDGIGMAAQLALLADDNIPHGPLECLFTVDEETGLSGAFALEKGFFSGKILLNLDSEDEGELFIGCAGGIDTVAYFDFEKIQVPKNHIAYKIAVSGLKGGHSGDDIEKGLGNANKILNRILWVASNDYKAKVAFIDAGNLRNAIAREAASVIVIPDKAELIKEFEKFFSQFSNEVKFEFALTEPDMVLQLEKVAVPEFIIDSQTQENLLNALYSCPHGVIAMSMSMPGLVETSTNLASVKFKDEEIIVTTSQRSSVNSSKRDIANMVESVFILAGAKVEHSDGYPGWAPDTNSEILQITKRSYKKLFGAEPKVRAIHAGLECGLFVEKYPGLDMVSFGPTLRGVHSPAERINIQSVQKFWDLLLEVLLNIPKQ